MNAVKKKNDLALLEDMIMKEEQGIVSLFKNFQFVMTDIFKIKKILLKKSNEKISKEREFYYRVSVKINLKNYMEYFKILDNQFSKKKIDSTKNINTGDNNLVLEPRKSAEIVIKNKEIPNYIKAKLKPYIYLHSSNNNTVSVYLRTKEEYCEKLSDLKMIKEGLMNNSLILKVYIVGGSKIVDSMTPVEKNEFRNFLLSY